VFDVCAAKKVQGDKDYEIRMATLLGRKSGELIIMRDSLYRFRMTGKASAYFSNMRFESGVLRSDQIDPFSSTVSFDQESRSLKLRANAQVKVPAKPDVNKETVKESAKTEYQKAYCPDGDPAEQIFLLLGPEGVKILNKNERLMLAMYTDSKPLISMLKQVSTPPDQKQDDVSIFQTLGEERARLTQAQSVVSNVKQELEIDEVSERLNPESFLKELWPMLGMAPGTTNDVTSKQAEVQP
jgi:hypothetical protein